MTDETTPVCGTGSWFPDYCKPFETMRSQAAGHELKVHLFIYVEIPLAGQTKWHVSHSGSYIFRDQFKLLRI